MNKIGIKDGRPIYEFITPQHPDFHIKIYFFSLKKRKLINFKQTIFGDRYTLIPSKYFVIDIRIRKTDHKHFCSYYYATLLSNGEFEIEYGMPPEWIKIEKYCKCLLDKKPFTDFL